MYVMYAGRNDVGKHITCVMLLLMVIFPFCAEGESLLRTQSLMMQGNWEEVEKSAAAVLESKPDNPDAYALMGMARFHLGRIEAAIESLESAAEGDSEYGARVLYYLGLAHSKNQNSTRSADAFARLLVQYPNSAEAQRLSGLSADVTVQAGRRSGFDMSGTVFSADAGYDSNPDLISDGDSDFVASFYLYSDIQFGDFPLMFGASVFLEKYMDLTENDFLSFSADVHDSLAVLENDAFYWGVELSQSLLDFEPFESELAASIEHTRSWDQFWVSDARLLGVVINGDEDGYDGTESRLRLRVYRFIKNETRFRRVRFKAQVMSNDRDDDLIGYDATSFGADCRLALPFSTSLDLGLDFQSRDYNGTDPFTERVRSDDIVQLSAYAVRPLDKNYYLTMQTIFTDRDSNDAFYSADELQLLMGILYVN